MKLFIDTANIEHIRIASKWGCIAGATTNPSLIAKEGRKLEDVVKEITTLIDGPISAEVEEASADEMVAQAKELAKIHKNIVIKLPMTMDGVEACSKLTKLGIKTNVTLVFSVPQAIMACEAGATYISPFMGRVDDAGDSGAELIEKIMVMINNYGYETEVIAASIRNLAHVEQAALAGADIATIPFAVLEKMVKHPLTDAGLKIFRDAASK
ncbi:MAG: fructose-6-phosphate aldolase [Erysipelotrichales bacterium]|nr:fructose-6-phosphate aldolase [Erysipelotrichales bacterium]